jgi:uncharacterized Fe-S center protein
MQQKERKGGFKMSKKEVGINKQTPLKISQIKEADTIKYRWTAKTQKVFTDKMRECADGILKTTDSAEDFLKRAGIVTKKGNLTRAYR